MFKLFSTQKGQNIIAKVLVIRIGLNGIIKDTHLIIDTRLLKVLVGIMR